MFVIAYKSGTGRTIAYPQIFNTQEQAQTFLAEELSKGYTWPSIVHVVSWFGRIQVTHPEPPKEVAK